MKRQRIPIYEQLGCSDWRAMQSLLLNSAPHILSADERDLLEDRYDIHTHFGRPIETTVEIATYAEMAKARKTDALTVRRQVHAALEKLKAHMGMSSQPRRFRRV